MSENIETSFQATNKAQKARKQMLRWTDAHKVLLLRQVRKETFNSLCDVTDFPHFTGETGLVAGWHLKRS
jgi:hypothetical protein